MSWRTIQSVSEIGKMGKKYGLNGELKLHVPEELLELCIDHGYIFLDLNGSMVPFGIEGMRYSGSYLVKLEGIDDPSQAVDLVSKTVLLPSELVPDDTQTSETSLEYAELKDYRVSVGEEIIGSIHDVQEFPQQEMAVVHTHRYGERLIPLNDEFILSVDKEERIVHMDLPEGLLAL